MNKTNIIRIQLKTPIWTGNVEQKCNKLNDTSIIGSIRWWFRVMLRSKNIDCIGQCEFEPMKYKNEIMNLEKQVKTEMFQFYLDQTESGFLKRVETQMKALKCGSPDCLIFGTNRWRKQITIRVRDENRVTASEGEIFCYTWDNDTKKIVRKLGKAKLFDLKSPLELEIVSSNSVDGNYFFDILVYILDIIAVYGGLGARTSKGYGLFDILSIQKNGNEENLQVCIKHGKELLKKIIDISKRVENISEPSFDQMFFYKYKLRKDNIVLFEKLILEQESSKNLPIVINHPVNSSAILRSWLRKESKKILDSNEFDVCFGTLETGSTLNFSGIYEVNGDEWTHELRFWGWIPHSVKKHSNFNETLHKKIIERLNLKEYEQLPMPKLEELDQEGKECSTVQ